MDDSSRPPLLPGHLRVRLPQASALRRRWAAVMLQPREFPETRASLMNTLREGPGRPGWREFFDNYAPAVFRVARLRGLDRNDADDVVQQVMLTIARRIGELDFSADSGRFRNWVRTVTENKIRDQHRKPQADELPGGDGPADDAATADAVWEEQWRVQDMLACLDDVVMDFAPRRVEAFRLYVLEGRPVQEVADRLGLSVGHIYVTRTQIINRIRARMLELGHAEDS